MTEVVIRSDRRRGAAGGRHGGTEAEPVPRPRRPRPHAALPSGRAVVGALLVTVAGVGVYAAYAGATTGPQGRAVIAVRAVDPGDPIDAGALGVVAVDLPEATAHQAFTDTGELDGAVALAPIAAGELVQRSAVAPPTNGSGPGRSHQFSFTVERDRALNGELRRGERVDLLATYGSGDAAYTAVVARSALVVSVGDGGGATLGSGGKLALTIELTDAGSVVRVAHASQVAAITLVRSTGVAEPIGPDVYRPDTPAPSRPPTSTGATGGTGGTGGTTR